jgi:peptidoglycan/LPS O-acetylase OafA/YrhL
MNTRDNPNLDLLRTIAVSFVVIFHLLLFFKRTDLGLLWFIGHWGVLLFFVHTSMVLMFSLERQEMQLPELSLVWIFYIRRCFRILPLSVLFVTVIGLLELPVGHLNMGHFQAVHLNAQGFVANLFLVQNQTGAESITAPMWSLPYEMQMYLVLPVLYLLIWTLPRVRLVLAVWLATTMAAYAVHRLFHGLDSSFLGFAPCFLAGVVSYRLSKETTFKLPFIVWPITIAVATYLYLRSPSTPHSWLLCLSVGVTLPFFPEMRSRWLRKICQMVARYSYGVYLVHFTCIWLAFVELGKLPIGLRWVAFLTTTAGISVILYHTVEAPMIAVGHRFVNGLAVRQAKLAEWAIS